MEKMGHPNKLELTNWTAANEEPEINDIKNNGLP